MYEDKHGSIRNYENDVRIHSTNSVWNARQFVIHDANMPLLLATLEMLAAGEDVVPTGDYIKAYVPFLGRSWKKSINALIDYAYPK